MNKEDVFDKLEEIEQMAVEVRDGRRQFDEIPFHNILLVIKDVYDIGVNDGDTFVRLYGNVLSEALAGQNRKLWYDVVMLLKKSAMLRLKDLTDLESSLRREQICINEMYFAKVKKAHLGNTNKIRKWYETHDNIINGRAPFQGKGVVYSAITGGYDTVKEPEYVSASLDYVLFTDNPSITSKKWKVIYIDNPDGLDSVRLARKIKILGHTYLNAYDYTIWVDGKLSIRDDLREYVDSNRLHEPMLCFAHYNEDCIYDEKRACATLKKDNEEIMEAQVSRYRKEGYPEHNGLIDSGILVREHKNEKVKEVMKIWWNEILNGSYRDQLSFNYACWKADFIYDTSELVIYRNKYVTLYNHIKA